MTTESREEKVCGARKAENLQQPECTATNKHSCRWIWFSLAFCYLLIAYFETETVCRPSGYKQYHSIVSAALFYSQCVATSCLAAIENDPKQLKAKICFWKQLPTLFPEMS